MATGDAPADIGCAALAPLRNLILCNQTGCFVVLGEVLIVNLQFRISHLFALTAFVALWTWLARRDSIMPGPWAILIALAAAGAVTTVRLLYFVVEPHLDVVPFCPVGFSGWLRVAGVCVGALTIAFAIAYVISSWGLWYLTG